jgi:nucleoid-associated protein YgaU
MMTVGLMRVAGKPVELSLDRITMKVMIEEFLPDYKNNNRIPFSITLRRVVDNRAFMQVANSIDRTIVNVSGSSNEDEKKPIMYEVKSGDTLMRIAAITKGDPNEWESIYRDNQDALANGPHLIYPGMKLVINRA